MDSFEDYIEQDSHNNDDELLEAAISNTYEYLVSDIEKIDLPAGTWMLRRPRRVATINQLIEYFTGTEEYEKCAELVKIKQDIN
tara:strand:+ start:479 stop:730 length:252 start_codon:yes stop_codon:yes gene_type:complete